MLRNVLNCGWSKNKTLCYVSSNASQAIRGKIYHCLKQCSMTQPNTNTSGTARRFSPLCDLLSSVDLSLPCFTPTCQFVPGACWTGWALPRSSLPQLVPEWNHAAPSAPTGFLKHIQMQGAEICVWWRKDFCSFMVFNKILVFLKRTLITQPLKLQHFKTEIHLNNAQFVWHTRQRISFLKCFKMLYFCFVIFYQFKNDWPITWLVNKLINSLWRFQLSLLWIWYLKSFWLETIRFWTVCQSKQVICRKKNKKTKNPWLIKNKKTYSKLAVYY